ncbi:MAG TPA: glycosyltransferase family 87 protein [Terriglobales bacterium]|nr:glycosyltransferase family 87 protein [Terriglobales bacterium]
MSRLFEKNRLAGVVLALVLAAGMWGYADLVLIPYEKADAAANLRPRGNLSDLYPRWLGTRELLLHGRDPYSSDVTREIQAGYYGRPLDRSRTTDPTDQQGFAYPVYVVFLLAPTVYLPFAVVQAIFRWILVAAVALSVWLWLRALSWSLTRTEVLIWIVLAIGSFPAVQGIKLQQLTLLVCALIAAATAALVTGNLITAGILLAIATIKPQLVGIFASWLLLWVVSDWRARSRFAWSFLLTLAVLIVSGEVVLPGWIGNFRAAASDYWQYTGGGKSLLDVILTPTLGRVASAVIIVLLAAFWWRLRRQSTSSETFAASIALTSAVTLMVIPTFAAYNQLLLLPAVMWIVRFTPALWRETRGRTMLLLTAASVFWPWVVALVLDLALLFVPQAAVLKRWAMPLWTTLLIPIVVVAALILLVRKPAAQVNRQ